MNGIENHAPCPHNVICIHTQTFVNTQTPKFFKDNHEQIADSKGVVEDQE